MACTIGGGRVRTRLPSWPGWMIHWPFSRPTILPTWCGQATTAPIPAAAGYLKSVETSSTGCRSLILMNLIAPCAALSALVRSTLRID